MIFHERQFVEVDLLLRRGGHINRSNLRAYEWVSENFEDLVSFYNSYGCALHRHPDNFIFMTTNGGQIRSRLLPKSCVHLGMFLALKMRDPEILRSSGRISLGALLQDLDTTVPRPTLIAVYAPHGKEGTSDERIVGEVNAALKILHELNLIELSEDTVLPLEALARFSEVARHENEPDEFARLQLAVQKGIQFREVSEQAHSDVQQSDNSAEQKPTKPAEGEES